MSAGLLALLEGLCRLRGEDAAALARLGVDPLDVPGRLELTVPAEAL